METYKDLFKSVIKFIKEEGLVGSVDKVRINSDLDVIIGNRFNKTITANKILAKLILWKTDKFGEVIVTDKDIKDMLKNELEKEINNLFNPCNRKDFEVIDATVEIAIDWIYKSTYENMLGSVGPVEVHKDQGDRVAIYLDGLIAINNAEINEKANLDELTNYFSKQVKKILNNKGANDE